MLYSIVKRHLGSQCRLVCGPALRLCLHPVHRSCTRAAAFSCPCDRGYRNAILPQWTGGFADPPDPIRMAMREFCDAAFGNFNAAILTLTSEISLMEMRLRSSPHALDDIRFLTLIHGAYFALAHGLEADDVDEKRRFRTVVRRSLANRSIEIKQTVAALAGEDRTPIRRSYFLRRCAIFEYCLAGDFTGGHDWDALLRWETLCAHFGVEITEEPPPLRPYTFCDLPDNFLHFFTPPWSLRRTNDDLVLSLLTGDCVSTTEGQESGEIDMEELSQKLQHTYSPILVLRGPHANKTIYMSFEWNQQYVNVFNPIYVDRFGDPDIGFHRGEVLKLSRDAVEREVDRLLSHAWTDAVV